MEITSLISKSLRKYHLHFRRLMLCPLGRKDHLKRILKSCSWFLMYIISYEGLFAQDEIEFTNTPLFHRWHDDRFRAKRDRKRDGGHSCSRIGPFIVKTTGLHVCVIMELLFWPSSVRTFRGKYDSFRGNGFSLSFSPIPRLFVWNNMHPFTTCRNKSDT